MSSCGDASKKSDEVVEEEVVEVTYSSFGTEITPDGAIDFVEMTDKFKNLEEGDTIPIKFASTISEVCQKKGCWMKMDLDGEEDAFVRFTDYGFFVPFNAGDHKAIVEGSAFISVVSVEELQHYAKDAGKSEEEINQITEPEKRFLIRADGVLIEDIALAETETEVSNEE